MSRSLGLDGFTDPAAGQMIVDNATSLHGGVDRGRPDEPEPGLLQPLGQGGRLRGRGGPFRRAHGHVVPFRRKRPEELVQRLRLAQSDRGPGIRDRGLDLASVADDRGVCQQPGDVALAERGDPDGLEAFECGPEALTLAQDGQPGEARLEPFEAKPLVETALIADGTPPFLVVVGVVPLVGRVPAALYVTSTLTTPSSTTTGYVSTGR